MSGVPGIQRRISRAITQIKACNTKEQLENLKASEQILSEYHSAVNGELAKSAELFGSLSAKVNILRQQAQRLKAEAYHWVCEYMQAEVADENSETVECCKELACRCWALYHWSSLALLDQEKASWELQELHTKLKISMLESRQDVQKLYLQWRPFFNARLRELRQDREPRESLPTRFHFSQEELIRNSVHLEAVPKDQFLTYDSKVTNELLARMKSCDEIQSNYDDASNGAKSIIVEKQTQLVKMLKVRADIAWNQTKLWASRAEKKRNENYYDLASEYWCLYVNVHRGLLSQRRALIHILESYMRWQMVNLSDAELLECYSKSGQKLIELLRSPNEEIPIFVSVRLIVAKEVMQDRHIEVASA